MALILETTNPDETTQNVSLNLTTAIKKSIVIQLISMLAVNPVSLMNWPK